MIHMPDADGTFAVRSFHFGYCDVIMLVTIQNIFEVT